jgi:hypothetical protein
VKENRKLYLINPEPDVKILAILEKKKNYISKGLVRYRYLNVIKAMEFVRIPVYGENSQLLSKFVHFLNLGSAF